MPLARASSPKSKSLPQGCSGHHGRGHGQPLGESDQSPSTFVMTGPWPLPCECALSVESHIGVLGITFRTLNRQRPWLDFEQ